MSQLADKAQRSNSKLAAHGVKVTQFSLLMQNERSFKRSVALGMKTTVNSKDEQGRKGEGRVNGASQGIAKLSVDPRLHDVLMCWHHLSVNRCRTL
jgi:hypothetical protein